MVERRTLNFTRWDQVLADLDQLERGYQQVGRWTLEQACRHLADWMRFPMDGFPPQPWFVRWLMKTLKFTIGPRQFQQILERGTMAANSPTMPETVHPDSGQQKAAVGLLRATIARFQAHAGPIHESPLFGAMTRETAERLQFIHVAHHLSFLIPHAALGKS